MPDVLVRTSGDTPQAATLSGGNTIVIARAEGLPGRAGVEVELSAAGTVLRWRHVGEPTWTPLYDLADLPSGGAAAAPVDASTVGVAYISGTNPPTTRTTSALNPLDLTAPITRTWDVGDRVLVGHSANSGNTLSAAVYQVAAEGQPWTLARTPGPGETFIFPLVNAGDDIVVSVVTFELPEGGAPEGMALAPFTSITPDAAGRLAWRQRIQPVPSNVVTVPELDQYGRLARHVFIIQPLTNSSDADPLLALPADASFDGESIVVVSADGAPSAAIVEVSNEPVPASIDLWPIVVWAFSNLSHPPFEITYDLNGTEIPVTVDITTATGTPDPGATFISMLSGALVVEGATVDANFPDQRFVVYGPTGTTTLTVTDDDGTGAADDVTSTQGYDGWVRGIDGQAGGLGVDKYPQFDNYERRPGLATHNHVNFADALQRGLRLWKIPAELNGGVSKWTSEHWPLRDSMLKFSASDMAAKSVRAALDAILQPTDRTPGPSFGLDVVVTLEPKASGPDDLNVQFERVAGGGATAVLGRLDDADGRLDGHDGRLDTADGRLDGIDTTLTSKADLAGGKLVTSQLPDMAVSIRLPVANQAARLALTSTAVQPGDLVVQLSDATTWLLGDTDPSVPGNWVQVSNDPAPVTSVNGQYGAVNLGAVDVNADPAGTAATQAALRLLKTANLSDLPSASTARANLGLGNSATRAVGTTTGTVADGGDSRFTNARTPTAHASTHAPGGTDDIGAALRTHGGREKVRTASVSGAVTVDLADGNSHRLTLTGNVTSITWANVTNGDDCSVTLRLIQGGTGSYTVTWGSAVKWAGGTAPTLSTAVGARDLVTLTSTDGGTTWDAFLAGKAMA